MFVGRCVLSGVNYQMRPQKSRVGPFNCHELPRQNVAKCMRSSLAAPPKIEEKISAAGCSAYLEGAVAECRGLPFGISKRC